jgi:hypothetical protein
VVSMAHMILSTKRAGPPHVGMGGSLLYAGIESVAVQEKVFAQRARGGASLGQALACTFVRGRARAAKQSEIWVCARDQGASHVCWRGRWNWDEGFGSKRKIGSLVSEGGRLFRLVFLAGEGGGRGSPKAIGTASSEQECRRRGGNEKELAEEENNQKSKEKSARARVDHVVGRWAGGGGGGGGGCVALPSVLS